MSILAVGSRWRSAVDGAEVIVVRAPSRPISLHCGGHPMAPVGSESPATAPLDPEFADGTPIGKRFVHAETGLEVLCTKPGAGSLSADREALELKSAKALPSSD